MELEDLYSFKIIDDPQISNDGKFIAYTQTVASKQYNNYSSKIIIYEIGAKNIIHEITDNYKNCSPRWNNKNELVYININKENNNNSIKILELFKNNSRVVIEQENSISDIKLSGCNNYISFLIINNSRKPSLSLSAVTDLISRPLCFMPELPFAASKAPF